jgi:crotonobetainyl-CoA:carnitine CoA-transferase CaiB-like acyl-CoA transferase
MSTSSEAPAGALSRFRVLELGSTVAAPFCGRLLADFGAEVIKVEDRGGDPARSLGRSFNGQSLYAATLFRNKRLVAIDLRKAEGQALVRKLVAQCDVVIENFRPGALEQWGLGYEQLQAVKPDLVMVRISGYGQTGPYRERAGYGIIGEAVSGLRYINGDPDRPPSRNATPLTDYITGLYAAFGTVLALLSRQFSGRGQLIDAALSECAFSFCEPFVPLYDKLGIVAQRTGSRMPDATPNNLYPTRDGDWIHIAAFADHMFRTLCGMMGRPELGADPRFATLVARNQHFEQVDEAISAWTATRDLADLEQMLTAANIPATRIFSMADIFRDPHFAARGMLADVADPDLDHVRLAAPVPRLSETPGRIRHAGRRVGEHTAAVLRELGVASADDIARLSAAGVIFCAERSS